MNVVHVRYEAPAGGSVDVKSKAMSKPAGLAAVKRTRRDGPETARFLPGVYPRIISVNSCQQYRVYGEGNMRGREP